MSPSIPSFLGSVLCRAKEASAAVRLAQNHACFSREHIMPSLTIRHVTTYRYRQPVAFGEHRMMLRPRDSHDQSVIEASLEISPEPRSLRFVQDAFGNHVGIARFSGRAKELCFESIVCLEHSPWTPPTSISMTPQGLSRRL